MRTRSKIFVIALLFISAVSAQAQYINPNGKWHSTSGSIFEVRTTGGGIQYRNTSTGDVFNAANNGLNRYKADFFNGNFYTHSFIISVLNPSKIMVQSTANGQTVYWDKEIKMYDCGVYTDDFNFYYSEQRNTNWCWATCIQMVLNYYGVYIVQEDIVYRAFGTDNMDNLPNWGGDIETIHRSLNNWNIDRSGREYRVSATFYNGAPSVSYLIDELKNERPLLIGYNTESGGKHASLITACKYSVQNGVYTIHELTVRDPWPGNGKMTYEGYDLARRIDAHWYIRVFK